ncbi:hypothetical protein [Pseudomonas sp. CGJS7]|uniref:hypothetical protein n=1 Tax=Pseudomonas sp. CGJS7 TaxID=3109348 RepID=UPI00300A8780
MDYYDGETEGLARWDNNCRYFRREKYGLGDEVSEYVSVAIDCSGFGEIADLMDVVNFEGVFVYSGSNHDANEKLDEVLPLWRAQCESSGRKSSGHSYLDSIGTQ